MPKKSENHLGWLLALLFLIGSICIVFSYWYENDKKENFHKTILGKEIDTIYNANLNFKYEFVYDSIYMLNQYQINAETVKLLRASDSAKQEIATKKALSTKERTRLEELTNKGDSIRNEFERKGMYFDRSEALKKIANDVKHNKVSPSNPNFYLADYRINKTIKHTVIQTGKRLIHKEKGNITPLGCDTLMLLNASYFSQCHLIEVDFLVDSYFSLCKTILNEQGDTIIPTTTNDIQIKDGYITVNDWRNNTHINYDFNGNVIENDETIDKISNWPKNIRRGGITLLVVALLIFLSIYQKPSRKKE